MILKKQTHPDESPALSNQDLYQYIYGKKPPGVIEKKLKKTKRFFRENESWSGSKAWHLAGCFFALLAITLLFFLLLGENDLRYTLFPLQLGSVAFFYLFILSKTDRESTLFLASGALAIPLAIMAPILAITLLPTWQTSALYLPVHCAICGIAAIFRSDENLEFRFVFFKALSYIFSTLMLGWLSFYVYNNLNW